MMHAYYIQRKYPSAEISFSCPRLCPVAGLPEERVSGSAPKWEAMEEVSERGLFQVMCAYRLFMPFAGITISTRERAQFRNHVVGMAATKISAGVSTGVGRHSEKVGGQGDSQFEIADKRNVHEIVAAIKGHGLQPVTNDYVYL